MTNPTETTGRHLVLFQSGAVADGVRLLNQAAGVRVTIAAEAGTDGVTPAGRWGDADGIVLPELGVAIVTVTPDQQARLAAVVVESGPIIVVEPERVVRAIGPAAPLVEPGVVQETLLTWGLQAIGADLSPATGAGMRVAVLDTGLDLRHPDLTGRTVVGRSFVAGAQVQDGHGHGTHCTGTACGPRFPEVAPGYGVAYESEIHVGKVLGDDGAGTDGAVLQGISWAVGNRCWVISLSLGSPTEVGERCSRVFEQAAQRAMQRGAIIIAAAGNESERRRGHIAPVGHPANCPSVLAVGAVDVQGRIADFASGTMDAVGQVDLVGPGVDVYSGWPMPTRYRRLSGTSMATPHVAGVAALIGQLHPEASPHEVWVRLIQSARRLNLPSTDVGAGMVQAPGAAGGIPAGRDCGEGGGVGRGGAPGRAVRGDRPDAGGGPGGGPCPGGPGHCERFGRC